MAVSSAGNLRLETFLRGAVLRADRLALPGLGLVTTPLRRLYMMLGEMCAVASATGSSVGVIQATGRAVQGAMRGTALRTRQLNNIPWAPQPHNLTRVVHQR
jgi:hypothetical protein